jgi:hypothetical protein
MWSGQWKPIENEPGWSRQLAVILSPEARKFLGPDIPELRYAMSITLDVTRVWSAHINDSAFDEVARAMSTQLPMSLFAHVVAERYYSFATYGSGKGRHDRLAETLSDVIKYLEGLSSSRVEHESLSHGVVIGNPQGHPVLNQVYYPNDFASLKRTPLLADGSSCLLWITVDGHPVGLVSRSVLAKSDCSRSGSQGSRELGLLASLSKRVRGPGVMLRKDGSIVIISDGHPLFVRRGGRWRGMLWKSVSEKIKQRLDTLGELLFDTTCQLSASGRGGVLALVEKLPPGIADKDSLDASTKALRSDPGAISRHGEWLFHALLSTRDVLSLGSQTLVSLAAIDGATIVDKNARLLAYGAVVPSHPTSSEGARTAAARVLSTYGLVIKVSADGPITIFEDGTEVIEV